MQSTDKFFTISQSILRETLLKKVIISWQYSRLFEPMSEGFGCGDKHSVVDSDRNSAKRSTVNKQLYDVTNIMRRYFRAAGT